MWSLKISHSQVFGANGGTTSSIDTTDADLIIVTISQWTGGSTGALTDNMGNTWIPLTARNGTNAYVRRFYAKNAIGGSGHTFSYAYGNSYPVIQIMAWSGSHLTSPFDVENGSTGNSSPIQTGSVTPSQDNSLIVSGMCHDVSFTVTIDSSFTKVSHNDYTAGVNMGGSHAYLVQAVAALINPSWTFANNFAGDIAVFLPAEAEDISVLACGSSLLLKA